MGHFSNQEVVLEEAPPEISRRNEVERFIDEFRRGHDDGVLAWVLHPMLHEVFLRAPRSRSGSSAIEIARHVAASQAARRGVEIFKQGRVGFAIDGTNLRRVLRPIIEARTVSGGEAVPVVPRLDRRRSVLWTVRALEYAGALDRSARDAGLPVSRADIRRYCLAGARALFRAESVMDPGRFRLLVVATQHAPNVRALLAIARERGIASLYFPHAPVGNNRQYADLPVDHAGLRGEGEVDFYRRLGVRDDLAVVGNPMVGDLDDEAPRELREAPVFAVSPYSERVLGELFRLVACVLGDKPLVVAPHPRSPSEQLERLMPATWRLSRATSTFQALTKGPRFLLQSSSGVAWEALALGIPVIQISYRGAKPGYALIREPFVPTIHSSRGLANVVHSVESTDRVRRGQLREWARHWCSSGGTVARSASADLVDACLGAGLKRPMLDGWGCDSLDESALGNRR
jgi:hypothetical protein